VQHGILGRTECLSLIRRQSRPHFVHCFHKHPSTIFNFTPISFHFKNSWVTPSSIDYKEIVLSCFNSIRNKIFLDCTNPFEARSKRFEVKDRSRRVLFDKSNCSKLQEGIGLFVLTYFHQLSKLFRTFLRNCRRQSLVCVFQEVGNVVGREVQHNENKFNATTHTKFVLPRQTSLRLCEIHVVQLFHALIIKQR
jgi:hypothetical protein